MNKILKLFLDHALYLIIYKHSCLSLGFESVVTWFVLQGRRVDVE